MPGDVKPQTKENRHTAQAWAQQWDGMEVSSRYPAPTIVRYEATVLLLEQERDRLREALRYCEERSDCSADNPKPEGMHARFFEQINNIARAALKSGGS